MIRRDKIVTAVNYCDLASCVKSRQFLITAPASRTEHNNGER